MTWIKDTYVSMHGETNINAEGCGIDGRTESTGLGVYYCIKQLLDMDSFIEKSLLKEKGVDGKTVVV
jgi:glutamate dehydrogenase (NAD(P)+)